MTGSLRSSPLLLGGLEHEHRDLPFGAPLVVGVRRICGDRAVPPRHLLVAAHLASDHAPNVWAVTELDMRVSLEVVVPDRVCRLTTHRRDGGVPAVVLDPHERGLADLA